MGDVVILGSYPEGLETDDLTQFVDRWTCWKFKSSSPRAIWGTPEPLLRAIIRQRGYLSIYPYYGKGLDIQYELRVKDFRVFDAQQGPPGITFPPFEAETANTWLLYQEARKLRRPIPRNRFMERPFTEIAFGPPRQISEAGWTQMWQTGVVFAELLSSS